MFSIFWEKLHVVNLQVYIICGTSIHYNNNLTLIMINVDKRWRSQRVQFQIHIIHLLIFE